VAFWFNQWGEWGPESDYKRFEYASMPQKEMEYETVYRIGRNQAGRTLNERTWDELTEIG
jgi:hypothetical protein